jgi:hypothetical protein
MQTPSRRAKLDGSSDSICLQCLLTIADGTAEDRQGQLNSTHECPSELMAQSRTHAEGMIASLQTGRISMNAEDSF